MRLEIIGSDHGDRAKIEAFVQETFYKVYQAHIEHFMPKLIRIKTFEDDLVAIVGYRDASSHSLYLEKYLDAPIEEVLTAQFGEPVHRQDVVEVGNLADASIGGSRAAIILITAFLYSAGYRWVVFTGVPMLRNAFSRLGLNPVELAFADPEVLSSGEKENWGNYYANQPLVMGGDIQQGFASMALLRRLLIDSWQDAIVQGHRMAKRAYA